ncbi:MAG: hypothetical protein GF330_09625 [Candidatus Eisenbacteria bacterium]|nr:hypothetical protein [Candidatus Eisenbacteria bacterium]
MTDRQASRSRSRPRPPSQAGSHLPLLAALLLLVGVPPALPQSPAAQAPLAAGADSLWQRAVEIAGRNAWWIPGTMVSRFEELDGDWEPKSVELTTTRIFLGPDGVPDTEIVSAYENEKDVTEKAREEAAEQKREEEEQRRKEAEQRRREQEERGAAPADPPDARERFALRSGGSTPFDPQIQDSVRVRRTSPEGGPQGGPFAAYQFQRDLGDERQLIGTAWLDPESGAPVEIRFAPDPLPGRVKELEMRMRFTVDSTGAWYPTDLRIQGMGKLLFFKKRFRSTMIFSDPWWYAPPDRATDPPDAP